MFYGTILDIVPVVVSKIKHHRTDNVKQPLGKSQVLPFLFSFWQENEEDKSALVDEYFQDHVNEWKIDAQKEEENTLPVCLKQQKIHCCTNIFDVLSVR